MSSPDESAPVQGPQEAAVAAVLAKPWKDITVTHRGPDGTEILAILFFYACPVCAAVITPPFEDNDYLTDHADWHLAQARFLDGLVS